MNFKKFGRLSGSAALEKTAAFGSMIPRVVDPYQEIGKYKNDPDALASIADDLSHNARINEFKAEATKADRARLNDELQESREYKKFLRRNGFKDGMELEQKLKQLGVSDKQLTDIIKRHAGGNPLALNDALEQMKRGSGNWSKIVEEFGEGSESKIYDMLKKSKNVWTLPKPTGKQLAKGGAGAAALAAGIYGLNRLAKNKGEYAFLDN